MAKPKEERNREFIKAWKNEGLTDRELQERFGLSEGGVKGLKARLRKKDPSLYIKPLASKLANKKRNYLLKSYMRLSPIT